MIKLAVSLQMMIYKTIIAIKLNNDLLIQLLQLSAKKAIETEPMYMYMYMYM